MKQQEPIGPTTSNPRHRRGFWQAALVVLAATLFLFVSAGAAFLGVGPFAPAAAEGQGQTIELQVEQCPDGSEPGSDGCESRQETVENDKPKRAPAPAPKPAPEPQGGETHSYDLSSGTGRVETHDGELEEETLEFDLSPAHGDEGGHDGHDDEEDRTEERAEKLLADSEDAGLQPVSTTGGSQFAGFGANMVSGDEALSRFAVPPFLVPIYVAAGRAYNVPWNLLAAINQIETDFGRIRHQVSYAGALGWMQFMPGTWKAYGVDASGDGVADPFNPVDAIYAAARYLSASGAPGDLRRAVFAYNHADWYVDRVLKTAGIYGSLPSGLIAETGSLAFGRFPVLGRVQYGDDFRRAQRARLRPRGLWITGQSRAKAIATQNVKVKRLLLSRRLARVFLQNGLSNRGLKRPSNGPVAMRAAAGVAGKGAKPASATTIVRRKRGKGLPRGYGISKVPGLSVVVQDSMKNRYSYAGLARLRRNVRPGARLEGGKAIGQLVKGKGARVLFSVKAAGGAPVDPRPLVDGYRLQEAADFYNAIEPLGGNPFLPDGSIDGTHAVSGSARQLAARVLSDSGIQIYPGGRDDIQRGVIDKRVLGSLLYLRRNGLELTVTSLRSGHSFYTAGGSISAHSFGAAADIAAFNGQPVLGNQGPGSLTEQAVKLLMRLEGSARPAQLITLMNLGGPSFAMSDHHDHLHLGYNFQSSLGAGRSGDILGSVDFKGGSIGNVFSKAKVERRHEEALSRKLSAIRNPEVSRKRGAGSLHVEAEARHETKAAERLARRRSGPLTADTTAAGARLVDVDIPADDARTAYAVGTVDGAGLKGWASTQTVFLEQRDEIWRVIGPPRNARNQVVNPRMRALATVKGGRGYAVGDQGAVVMLRGSRAPLLLPRVTRTRLNGVDAATGGRSIRGVAVGHGGKAVRLSGGNQVRERVGSGRAKLNAVLIDGDSVLASGAASGEGLTYRRGSDGWSPTEVDLGLPTGLRVRLTSLDKRGEELWVSGGLSDAGTLGTPAEMPVAARLSGGDWTTFCAGTPALAAVAELGTPTKREICDSALSGDPNDYGAAGEIEVTRRGVVVATSRGLYLYDYRTFNPILSSPSPYQRLALNPGGNGWAVAEDGRLARIRPTVSAPDGAVEQLPMGRGGKVGVIAAAPSGDRVLAIAGGKGAVREEQGWQATNGPVVGLRTGAFASEDHAWATDETGVLLQLRGKRWSISGSDGIGENMRMLVARALGRDVLSSDPARRSTSGIQALDFDGGSDGYAVGAGGLVVRYDGDGWSREHTPAAVPLTTVATAAGRAVAAGRQGVLIERVGDDWKAPREPRALVGRRHYTAADALSDGTLLAAAGGVVLERTADKPWRRALLQPLGVEVRRLAGYRTESGALRVLALAGSGEDLALLQGGPQGWRPVAVPSGIRVADFNLRSDSLRLWVVGYRYGQPVAARVPLAARPKTRAAKATTGVTGWLRAGRDIATKAPKRPRRQTKKRAS